MILWVFIASRRSAAPAVRVDIVLHPGGRRFRGFNILALAARCVRQRHQHRSQVAGCRRAANCSATVLPNQPAELPRTAHGQIGGAAKSRPRGVDVGAEHPAARFAHQRVISKWPRRFSVPQAQFVSTIHWRIVVVSDDPGPYPPVRGACAGRHLTSVSRDAARLRRSANIAAVYGCWFALGDRRRCWRQRPALPCGLTPDQ